MPKRFEFSIGDDKLIGDLYLPDGIPKGVVVTTGPLTSVKEQASGAYAAEMSKNGFAALAFDHRYFGESDGAPRQYESPQHKIDDIRAAVDALEARFPDKPIYALGICAGAGYMAGAVAVEPRFQGFAAVAGFYHDAEQSKEWMGDGYEAAIATGRSARENWEATEIAETIPAVASTGDRAMPMDEAFAFYGTERGGEARYPNYRNAFAVMSREVTTPYDSQKAADAVTQPFLMIHSENALAPLLACRYFDRVQQPKEQKWVESTGQIDFYDEPALITPATGHTAAFFSSLA